MSSALACAERPSGAANAAPLGGRIAVIDFETTGMGPDQGARATEIGIVIVQDGQIVDRYQSLMNAGVYIPSFIEELTGITNAMIRRAPPAAQAMAEAAEFVGALPLVAHNAAFDRKFWIAELARIDRSCPGEFACSVLLSRRLFPEAPSHKLGTLVSHFGLPVTGRFHRALADAEMTAHLLLRIGEELQRRHGIAGIPHALLCQLQRTPKGRLGRAIDDYFGAAA